MIEPLILGFTWLDKWQPAIWWEGGFRRIRLALGQSPIDHAKAELNKTDQNTGGVFPSVYKDLAEVFSEEECEVLPPPNDQLTMP